VHLPTDDWQLGGRSGPMRPRHGQSPKSLPVSFFVAATQLDFPKAVVRASLDRVDLNRSFAARLIDVSHAD
jgi:hypothetical protein